MSLLKSLRILDFTTLLPGPYATMLLADLGANVLRVENTNRLDAVRFIPPYDENTSTWHQVLNRNKKSIALDFKLPQSRDIIRRLVSSDFGNYDLVVEQFRPGYMKRHKLDYLSLREENASLIYCSISGYGQTGPYRNKGGHDNNYLSLSGALSHSGKEEAYPSLLGLQVADIGGGSFGALLGLLAAVISRQATEKGQMIDVSMFDMMISWQAHIISHQLVANITPKQENWLLNGGSYYGYYETKDNRFLSVGSLEPQFWKGLCIAIKRPDLISKGIDLDKATQTEIKLALSEEFAKKTLDEWQEQFEKLDICVEPVLTIPEMLEHPQTHERELIVDVPKPDGTFQKQVSNPLKFSDSVLEYRHVGTDIGSNTTEILEEIGYHSNEIELMRKNNVIRS